MMTRTPCWLDPHIKQCAYNTHARTVPRAMAWILAPCAHIHLLHLLLLYLCTGSTKNSTVILSHVVSIQNGRQLLTAIDNWQDGELQVIVDSPLINITGALYGSSQLAPRAFAPGSFALLARDTSNEHVVDFGGLSGRCVSAALSCMCMPACQHAQYHACTFTLRPLDAASCCLCMVACAI